MLVYESHFTFSQVEWLLFFSFYWFYLILVLPCKIISMMETFQSEYTSRLCAAVMHMWFFSHRIKIGWLKHFYSHLMFPCHTDHSVYVVQSKQHKSCMQKKAFYVLYGTGDFFSTAARQLIAIIIRNKSNC